MTLGIATIDPLVSLLFGILIFIFPQFLNYLVATYLVIIGILGLGLLR